MMDGVDLAVFVGACLALTAFALSVVGAPGPLVAGFVTGLKVVVVAIFVSAAVSWWSVSRQAQ